MMGRLRDAVDQYLAGRGWPSEEIANGVFELPVVGKAGNWMAYFSTLEDEQQVLVYSVLPTAVPPDRLVEAALFLTRANFGLVIGNFELDLESGEIRFKTSVDVEGVEINDALVDHLLLAGVIATDRYLPGIAAVIGGQQAVASIEMVEAVED
jgi:hypothetical protein